MRLSTLVWALAFAAAGILVATGNWPGADAWASGPRIGIATMLLVLSVTMLLVSNAAWFIRKTTKPEDYQGGCPVGGKCACGEFNFKPRKACKACGARMAYAS